MSKCVCQRHRFRGFTMVELVITMLVAVVLIVIAVPSFNYVINSSRLTTVANDLVASLNIARLEAVKLNADSQFCSNSGTVNNADTLGAACGTQAGAVYALFTPPGSAQGTAATGNEIQAVPTGFSSSSIQIHGTVNAVRFGGLGLGYLPGTSIPYTGIVIDVCSTRLSSNNHVQIAITGGSIISSSPSTGACP